MKPKEFDDLVRQKFDQNDFAYNPAHWDQLAEKLDGNKKKRSIIMWWWVPLAGMAASVALAFGVSTMLRMSAPANQGNTLANTQTTSQQHIAGRSATASNKPEIAQILTPVDINAGDNNNNLTASANNIPVALRRNHKHTATNNRVVVNKNTDEGADDGFSIRLPQTAANTIKLNGKPAKLKKSITEDEAKKEKQLAINEAFGTFMPEEEAKVTKPKRVSVILSGGYNRGNQNSGYMAGATIRKMLNDKVYIEGQVAFASSNNTQSTSYIDKEVIQAGNSLSTGRTMTNTSRTTNALNKNPIAPATRDVVKQKDVNYDLYYAQVTPSVGYNIMKKMSIGLGPDFQRMLVDNRPAPSTAERGTIQVAPLFDIGFIGKTELAVTKKLRAGLYYRKGVNNVITPMGKFIDRDYMQFQLKYTILNK